MGARKWAGQLLRKSVYLLKAPKTIRLNGRQDHNAPDDASPSSMLQTAGAHCGALQRSAAVQSQTTLSKAAGALLSVQRLQILFERRVTPAYYRLLQVLVILGTAWPVRAKQRGCSTGNLLETGNVITETTGKGLRN